MRHTLFLPTNTPVKKPRTINQTIVQTLQKMKKVININFQGRVIPIEEGAYEILQEYITSLRNYFAKEEGRDEIINDIENRIAELFGEHLKKGASCITVGDVEKIMASMGRPQDFEAAEDDGSPIRENSENARYASVKPEETQGPSASSKKRLYRDEEDKILGGVSSGIANYFNIDPSIIRIAFALLTVFGGSGFLIYIVFWIVLPSRSLVTNVRKRLFRDTEDRVIGGVGGGLAKYFDISPAYPRIIFAAPFIFGIITSIGHSLFNPFPIFVGSFGGGTFILAYIILWIVLPEAKTAAEKLEMRGEKVDLNTIRNTVVNDLQGLKGKAEKMGAELKTSAEKWGGEMKEQVSTHGSRIVSDTGYAVRRSSSGLGHAIGVLVKVFVFFILGIIAFALFVALIAIMGSGVGVLPLREYLLEGAWQNFFAWGTILLFVGVPIIALLVWLIRRLMRVKSGNKYLGYGFTGLWLAGLICFVLFVSGLKKNFSSLNGSSMEIPFRQPTVNYLQVGISNENGAFYDNWLDMDGLLNISNDSIMLNTVRLNVVKSKDDQYHVQVVKISRGSDRQKAAALAEKIDFRIVQTGDQIYLPEGFRVSKNDKWRNQRVIVVLEVPVGGKIKIDHQVNDYDYFQVDLSTRRNRRNEFNRTWDESEYYEEDKIMLMTANGLEQMEDNQGENEADTENKNKKIPTPPASPVAPIQPDSIRTSPSKDTLSTYRYSFLEKMLQTVTGSDEANNALLAEQNYGITANPMAMVFRW